MKAKRLIALALAAVFMLSAAATPVFAAAALPQENAARTASLTPEIGGKSATLTCMSMAA